MVRSYRSLPVKKIKPIRHASKNRAAHQQQRLTPEIEKNFDIVLESVRAEYQGVVYSTWATQNSKLHTYLWLSVAIVGAEGAVFISILKEPSPNKDILFILFFAMSVAFVGFCMGVDAMRSREVVMRPVFGDDYSRAIEQAKSGKDDILLREETIEALVNCINIQLSAVDFLGKRMQNLSWILFISSIIGAVGFMCHILF